MLISKRALDGPLQRGHAIVILSTSKIIIRQSDSDQQRFPLRHYPNAPAMSRAFFSRRARSLVRRTTPFVLHRPATDTRAGLPGLPPSMRNCDGHRLPQSYLSVTLLEEKRRGRLFLISLVDDVRIRIPSCRRHSRVLRGRSAQFAQSRINSSNCAYVPVRAVAGLLLFGLNVNRFLPQAGVDAVAYPGREKDYAAVERAALRGPMTPLRTNVARSSDYPIVQHGHRTVDLRRSSRSDLAGAVAQRHHARTHENRLPRDAQPTPQGCDARLRLPGAHGDGRTAQDRAWDARAQRHRA